MSIPDRDVFYLGVSGVLSPPKLYKSAKNTSWVLCIGSQVPWWHKVVKIKENSIIALNKFCATTCCDTSYYRSVVPLGSFSLACSRIFMFCPQAPWAGHAGPLSEHHEGMYRRKLQCLLQNNVLFCFGLLCFCFGFAAYKYSGLCYTCCV